MLATNALMLATSTIDAAGVDVDMMVRAAACAESRTPV